MEKNDQAWTEEQTRGASSTAEGSKEGLQTSCEAGRKPQQKSRSTEFRQSLIAWKRTPESRRPSLRALAAQLGTSHQLLKHYLDGLEKWRCEEQYRVAKRRMEEIKASAQADDRELLPWEEAEVRACNRAVIGGLVGPMILDNIARLKQKAQNGPLFWQEIKILKIFAAQGFSEAKEVLQKCTRSSVKRQRRVKRKNDNLPPVVPPMASPIPNSFRHIKGLVLKDRQLR
jgi:predicted secreted protein